MTSPAKDELQWCRQCDEWMYARQCGGDPKCCERKKRDGFYTAVTLVFGGLAWLCAALLVVQIGAFILHITGFLP